jgi:hypothetical protein
MAKSIENYKNELLAYFNYNWDKVVDAYIETLSVESEVKVDTDFLKDDGKRYCFFGNGCGIAFPKYDARGGKGKKIEAAFSHLYNDELQRKFINGFTPLERSYYNEKGAPLTAIWAQDLHLNVVLNKILCDYMTMQGVKNAYVKSYVD